MAIQIDQIDALHVADDHDLVERYQAGDAAAFDALYHRYHPRLRRFCRRHVGDPHTAEELAQEAFVRALRALPRLGGERRFYPWLTVIARRLCIDHHRRHGRTVPRAEIDPGVIADSQDALTDRVDIDHLHQALARVRARHREVLHLRDWDELSYEEIAERIGTPTSTVPSLIQRARIAVRREFLAVSERATGVLIPLLTPLLTPLRERRYRFAARLDGRLADPGLLAAPLAAATLGAAALFGFLPPPATPDPQPPSVQAAGSPVRIPERSASPVTETPVSEPAPAPPAAANGGQPSQAPVAEVFVGPDGTAAAKAQSAQLPLRAEVGPTFAGADPHQITEDADSALAELFGGAR